jgi:Ca2+-binding EF-hand superfamily protein
MSFQAFVEAMDNKISTSEKSKLQAYFRAFDAQQKSYLTYSDYLIGLFILNNFHLKSKFLFI